VEKNLEKDVKMPITSITHGDEDGEFQVGAGENFLPQPPDEFFREQEQTWIAQCEAEAENVIPFDRAARHKAQEAPQAGDLICRRADDFVSHKYAPRELVLAPWLPTNGLAAINGVTGLGKTWLALATACAIAGGGEVLGWKAGKPRKVLYVDGEMPITEMQERVRAILTAAEKDGNGDPALGKRNLFLLCDGEQKEGIPNLATPQGRKQIEDKLRETGAEVLYLDNLSCLVRDAEQSENGAESWVEMQEWLLKLRRSGHCGVYMHHTGKAKLNPKTGKSYYQQRGTSKREDVLNTSILLVPAGSGKENEFKIIFTKHRSFIPEPMGDVAIVCEDGEARLVFVSELEGRKADAKRVAELHEQHLDWGDGRIAEEMGWDPKKKQSTINRAIRDYHKTHPGCSCKRKKAA
jgi:hypothetical protein